jgi:hypothetical protein
MRRKEHRQHSINPFETVLRVWECTNIREKQSGYFKKDREARYS